MATDYGELSASTVNLDQFARRVAKMLSSREPPSLGVHPRQILSLCSHHGVLPLLGYRFRQHFGDLAGLADEHRERIEQSERETLVRYTLARGALNDALVILKPFRPVLFKGIAAAGAWPLRSLRDPGDLDLLVAQEAFPAAKAALLNASWTEQPTVHGHLNDVVSAKYGFARVFRHPSRPVTVDLHREPVDRTEPFRVDPVHLLATAVLTEVANGVVVAVPGPVEHLCLLALHAVRHGTFRLQGFVDVFMWLERHKNAIRDIEITKYIRDNRIFRAVSVALLITQNLFEDLPLEVRGFDQDPVVRFAAARRKPGVLVRSHLTARGGVRRLIALIDLIDSPVLALRYVFRLVFPAPEIMGLPSGNRIFAYLRQRIKTFLHLLPSFERLEKDS
ncbi:MAG: nucleotidyltransferase family protein [bacterium]